MKLYIFRAVSLPIIRSYHCTFGTGPCYTGMTTACVQDQDGTAVPSWSCTQAVVKPAWHVPVPNVQWITPDDGQRNCPKHVQFRTRINLEISASVGFIAIYYVARSCEHKIWHLSPTWNLWKYVRGLSSCWIHRANRPTLHLLVVNARKGGRQGIMNVSHFVSLHSVRQAGRQNE